MAAPYNPAPVMITVKQAANRPVFQPSVQVLIGAASPRSKMVTSPKREFFIPVIILEVVHRFPLVAIRIKISWHKKSSACLEKSFVKTAAKILAANEFNRPCRVPNKWTKHPGDLAAEKQIRR